MANSIVLRCSENENLSNYLRENLSEELMQEWKSFVESTLHEINIKQETTLVS